MRRNNPFFKKKAETQRLLKVKPLSGIYYVFKYMVKFLNYSVSKLQISLSIVCWDWMWGRRCFWDPAQFVLMLLGVSSLLQWEYHSTLLEYFFFLIGIISLACLSCFECKQITHRCVWNRDMRKSNTGREHFVSQL